MKKPVFFDITLRDGNQSLKRPWNIQEKERVFHLITDLGVPIIEAGFPASSEMDFNTCRRLSEIAPENVRICSLARTKESDILRAIDAIQPAKLKRIHTFIAMSPFNMQYVLNKSANEVQKIAVEAVEFIKSKVGNDTDIEFSAEHFGDCAENIDFVIDSFQKVVKAGATTINLPNTVERTRVKHFVDLVEKVKLALPDDINISVHCHNDLGMATACTVESYFSGAVQLECGLNGLGERAGNTNIYEVAIALHNSGVDVPLNLSKIYETALVVAEMAKLPIYEKAPLIGPESLAHRSGIHQDGALKTKDMEKGAYRPIHPTLIGRSDDEKIRYTSQSGKTALFEIISEAGYPITLQEAERIAPIMKESAEKIGELPTSKIIDIYFKEVFNVKGPFHFISMERVDASKFKLWFTHNDEDFKIVGTGNGPIDATINAIKSAGFECKLINYEQKAIDSEIMGSGATAMTVIQFESNDGKTVIARGRDENHAKANVKAIFNGLNIMYK